MSKRNKKGRDIDGVVLLDKNSGGSSNHFLQQVKRLFDANKAGHTGSLDPLASGFFRSSLSKTLDFRHTPSLRFIYDAAPNTGARIDDILSKL